MSFVNLKIESTHEKANPLDRSIGCNSPDPGLCGCDEVYLAEIYLKLNNMAHYILDGKKVKEIDSLIEWGEWYGTADRHVAKTKITDGIEVSTIFLGLDHSFGGDIPILFETMIFGGEHDEYQKRYATWEEAETGHLAAVKLCKIK